MSPIIHFVTYHTSHEKAKYLFETAKFHKIEITNIAKDFNWGGFKDRLIAMRDLVKTLPPDDIVCFLDAYDGLINADKDEFIQTFLSQNAEIVFGAELLCWPPTVNAADYPESNTVFKYVNAGFYIGYVRALQKMLLNNNFEALDKEYNDQEFCGKYFTQNYKKENIKLDSNANLVINLNKIPWTTLEIVNGYVHFKSGPINSKPCFIHFNGMSYLDIFKDVTRNGNSLSFDYNKVYDRTFIAVLASKLVSQKSDVICHLTGRGMTY